MDINNVINKLNQFNELDPVAAYELCTFMVPVNEKLTADDVPFMCGRRSDGCVIGSIGLINGLVFPHVICAVIDNDEKRVLHFELFELGKKSV
ncbi:hypothetical protein [Morganella morganii]|uniref:hypothetical protein n=1 Tax=Morganella morganii TaxID=582 RepID=UPI001C454671|nr:hypothetical protein [Morganella morganii]QXO61585.1 hypothetical protein JC826_19590 [Morganella morganii]QXO69058.1 hypothetical protein JC792_19355 [Morganella morganii]